MYQIPSPTKALFDAALESADVPLEQRKAFRKWYAYYWDFCQKYDWAPDQDASLKAFLSKLAEKRQNPERQEQARQAVLLSRMRPVAPERKARDCSKRVATPSQDLADLEQNSRPANPWQHLYDELESVIRTRHYSLKTLKGYRVWIRQFQGFVDSKAPEQLSAKDVKDYLSWMAVSKEVAASSQNQAFNALLFFFKHVLKRKLGNIENTVRAKRKPYIPVVLSRQEIDRIIAELEPPYDLVVKLLYGCGLRIKECVSLRIQNFNFDHFMLTIHDGKGKKDRTVPLPRVLIPELRQQIDAVARQLEQDLAKGASGTFLFNALEKKYKNAPKELVWQHMFPARMLTLIPETQEYRRYHLHETHVQRAITAAVRKARIPKRASAHTFRHSYATHLLQANYDIVTIQHLLGHSDIRTTLIYLQTVSSQTLKTARSPLDFEPERNTEHAESGS